MNEKMNFRADEKWRNLLARSAATFAGNATPPYGFVTATLARLSAEQRQQEEFERIGWRALLASVAALFIAATVTLTLNYSDQRGDFEPGTRSLIQMDNIPVS